MICLNSITQPLYVFVTLGIQLTVRLRRHLWPAPLYIIFPHLINGTIFEKKIDINVCVRVCVQLLSEIFFNLRRIERDYDRKFVLVVM